MAVVGGLGDLQGLVLDHVITVIPCESSYRAPPPQDLLPASAPHQLRALLADGGFVLDDGAVGQAICLVDNHGAGRRCG